MTNHIMTLIIADVRMTVLAIGTNELFAFIKTSQCFLNLQHLYLNFFCVLLYSFHYDSDVLTPQQKRYLNHLPMAFNDCPAPTIQSLISHFSCMCTLDPTILPVTEHLKNKM